MLPLHVNDGQHETAAMGLLQPGQKIGATYEVERFLGEGACAEVYRVKHRFLGRQALKVLTRIIRERASDGTFAGVCAV